MQSQTERFTNRFDTLFAQDGLTNVKFFIKDKAGLTLSSFLEEACEIQSAIAAGDCRVVETIDADITQKHFMDAF
jgi:hypothetical protein